MNGPFPGISGHTPPAPAAPVRKSVTPKIFHKVTVLTIALTASPGPVWAGEDIFMRTMADGSVELSNVPVEQNFELLLAAPGTPGASPEKAAARTSPQDGDAGNLRSHVAQYREIVAEAARQATVDPRLLHAVIAVESGYNPQALSIKGAIGLMQLMPGTVRRYGVGDARDPLQNILAGARYLRDLLKLFNNDVSLALAAYNAGENAVLRHGSRIPPYRETAAYVPKVLAIYRKLENLLI